MRQTTTYYVQERFNSVLSIRNDYICVYVWSSHIAREWINRVRLPILLVVSWTGKINISLSPFAPENLVSRDGFGSRQPAHLHTQAESVAYLRDSCRFPPYAIGSVPSLSDHAIAYRWRSLPRVRRHRASKPQGSFSHGCCLGRSPCVCVCVFFPFILDINFVGRTSRGHTGGRSHRISHPPSFCGACLNFSREKDSAIPSPR